MKKRLISVLVAMALCLTLLPSAAWAAGSAYTESTDEATNTITYTFTTFHNVNAGNSYGAQTFRVDAGTNVVLDFTHVPQREVTGASFVLDLTADDLTVTVEGDPAVDYGECSITVNAHPTVGGTVTPVDHFLKALRLENFQTSARIDIDTNADHPAPVCFDGACRVFTIAADYLTLSAADDAASLSLVSSLWDDGALTMDGGTYQMGANCICYPQVTVKNANLVFSKTSGFVNEYQSIEAQKLTIEDSTIQGIASIYSVEAYGNAYQQTFADSYITIRNSVITYGDEVKASYNTGMLCNAKTITIEGSTITGAAAVWDAACIGGIFKTLTIKNSEVYIESEVTKSGNRTSPAIGPDDDAYTKFMIELEIDNPSITIEDSTVQAASRHSAAIGLPYLKSSASTTGLPQLSITIQGDSDITATSVYSPAIGGSSKAANTQDDGLVAAQIVVDNPGGIGAWEQVDGGESAGELSLAAAPANNGLSTFSAGADVSLMNVDAGSVLGDIENARSLLDNCTITIEGTPTISAKSGVLAVYGTVNMEKANTSLVQATMVRTTGSSWSVYPMETPGDVTIGTDTIGQLGYGYASVAGTGVGVQTDAAMAFGDSLLKDVVSDSFNFTVTDSGFKPFYVTPQELPISGTVTLKKGSDTVITAAVGETLTADLTGLSPVRAKDRTTINSYIHLDFQWYRDGAEISNATGTAYTLTNSDNGKIITCVVSVKSGDTMFSGSVTSYAVLTGTTSLDAPTLDSRTVESITLGTVSGCEYGILKDGGIAWHTDTPQFTGLTKGTAYTFVLKDDQGNLSTPATFYTLSDIPAETDFAIDYVTERLSFPAGVNLYSDADCQTTLNTYSPRTWVSISSLIPKTGEAVIYARYSAVDASDTESVTEIKIPARPEVNQVTATVTGDTITFTGVSGVAYRLTLDDAQVGEIKIGDGTGSIEFTGLQPGTEYVLMMRQEASNTAPGNFRSAQVNQTILTLGSYEKDSTLLANVEDTERSYDLTSLLGGLDITKAEKADGSFVANASCSGNTVTLTFGAHSAGEKGTVTITAKDTDGTSTLTLTLTVKAVEVMAVNQTTGVFWVREEAHPGYVGMDNSSLSSAWAAGLNKAGLSNHTHENSFALVPRYVVGGGTAAQETETPKITWTVDGAADAANIGFTVLYIDNSKSATEVEEVKHDGDTLTFNAQSKTALYLVAWKEIQDVTVTVELKNGGSYRNDFQFGDTLTAQITVRKAGSITGIPLPTGTAALWLGEPDAVGSKKLGEGTLGVSGYTSVEYPLRDWSVLKNDPQTLYIVYSGDDNYKSATKTETVLLKATAPDKPVLTADPSVGAVTLTWEKPAENGTAITGYTLEIKQGDQAIPTVYLSADDMTYTVNNLTGGLTYTFTLTANSNMGSSTSAPVTAVPISTGETLLLLPAGSGSQDYYLESVLGSDTLQGATVEVSGDNAGIITNTAVRSQFLTLTYDTTGVQVGDTVVLKVTTATKVLTLTAEVVESLLVYGYGANAYCWVRSDPDYSLAGFSSQEELDAAWTNKMESMGIVNADFETFALHPRRLVGGESVSVFSTQNWMSLPEEVKENLNDYHFTVLSMNGSGNVWEVTSPDPTVSEDGIKFGASYSRVMYRVIWQKNTVPDIQVFVWDSESGNDVFQYGETLKVQITVKGTGDTPTGTVALYLGDPQNGALLGSEALNGYGVGIIESELTNSAIAEGPNTLTIVYTPDGASQYTTVSTTRQITVQMSALGELAVTPTPGYNEVTLNWNAPSAPVTGYTLEVKQDGTTVDEITDIDPGATSYTVQNLTGGLTYTFTLTAYNGVDETVSPSVTATPLTNAAGTILLAAGETDPRSYDLSRWLDNAAISSVMKLADGNDMVEQTTYNGASLTISSNAAQAGQTARLLVIAADKTTLELTVEAVEVMARTDTVFWVKKTAQEAGMGQDVSTLESYLSSVLGMTGAATDAFALLPRTIAGNEQAGSNAETTVTWTPDSTLDMESYRFAVAYFAKGGVSAETLTHTQGNGSLQFTAGGGDGLYLVAWQGYLEAEVSATFTNDGQETDTFQFGDTLTAQIKVTGSAADYAPFGTVKLYQGDAAEGKLLSSGSADQDGAATLTYMLDNSVSYGENIQLTIVYEGNSYYSAVNTTETLNFQALAPDKPELKADPRANAVELTWQAPDIKGAPITGYTLEVEQGGTTVDTIDTIGPDDTSYTVAGLTSGLAYTFTLTVRSDVGDAASDPVTARPLTDGTEVILLPVGSGVDRDYDLSALLDGAEIKTVTEGAESDNILSSIAHEGTVLKLTGDAVQDGQTANLTVTAEKAEGSMLTLDLIVKAVTVMGEQNGVFFVQEYVDSSLADMTPNELLAAWDVVKEENGFQNASQHSFTIRSRNIVGGDAATNSDSAVVIWTPSESQIPLAEGSFLVLHIGKGNSVAESIAYQRTDDSLTFTADGEDGLYCVVYKEATGGAVTVSAELQKNGTATSAFRYGDTLTVVVTIEPVTTTSGLKPGGTVELRLGSADGLILATGTMSNGSGTITYVLNDNSILSYDEQTLYIVYPGDNNYLASQITVKAYLQPAYSGGGGGGGGGGTTTYPVTVSDTEHGTVTVSHKNAAKGYSVTVTTVPDAGCELRALTVTDKDGNEIELTDKGDGNFTFTMPASKVTVTAVFAEIPASSGCDGGENCPLNRFTDVDAHAWYHDGVHFCLDNGLMAGYGNGLFGPNDPLSRAMLVQILYNYENQPTVSSGSVFDDVADGAWYADAVTWAASQGIVDGYGDGMYGPDDFITREQLAAILWRYAVYKGDDVSVGEDTNILSYSDASEISEYAVAAFQWACGAGVIEGVTESTLVPQGNATRAQAATMLMRFCELDK